MEIQKFKQKVYLPVKVEDELPEIGKATFTFNEEIDTCSFLSKDGTFKEWYQHFEHKPTHWLKPQEVFVFTSEQLNQLLSGVIKDTLNTAADKAEIEQKGYFEATPEECLKGLEIYDDNGSDRPAFIAFINKQSITNTFEETCKKFEV